MLTTMAKFRVNIIAEYSIIVDAETEEEAEEVATETFWHEGPDGYSVETVEQINGK